MKINELEKIIEKLRYYKVEKNIENISKYLKNLTQTEIDNILSMNYDKNIIVKIKTFDYTMIFNNHKLLKSLEFKKILDVILVDFPKKYNKSKYIADPTIYPFFDNEKTIDFRIFYEILESDVAWNGGYIFDDIEKIYNKLSNILDMLSNLKYKNDSLDEKALANIKNEVEKVITMKMLATNETSLKKSSHNIAMDNISVSKSVIKAQAIYGIQTSNNFKTHSPYKYFGFINRAKTDKVVEYLQELILSDKLVDEELEIVVSAHSDEMAKILYTVAKTVINSEAFDEYLDIYIDDLQVIARTENIETAKELAKLTTSLDSLKKHKHSKKMRMISGISDVQKVKTFVNVELDEKGTYDDLDVILYNAQSYVDEQGYDMELPANIYKINKKYNNKK